MKKEEAIQLLFDGNNRGWRTGIDCVRLLCSTQVIWTGFEKLSQEELDTLEENENHCDICDDIINNAECKLINGQRFTLHWSDGSIFAVEDSALEQFGNDFN